MTDLKITDLNSPSCFVMIPWLVDDMGLSPYAVRLYLRMVRRAGNGGTCYENTRNLAKGCRMSTGKVSAAKVELEGAGLISVETKPGKHGGREWHDVTILSIWEANHKKYLPSSSSELENIPKRELASSPGEPKYIVFKGDAKKSKKPDAASAYPIPSGISNEISSGHNNTPDSSKQDKNIQILKKVTGYYPPKALRPKLIELFKKRLGPDGLLDENIFGEIYTNWIARGYSPMNYTGILQRYFERDYYTLEQDKFTALSNQ